LKSGSYIAILVAVLIAAGVFFLPKKPPLEAEQRISEVDLLIDSAMALVTEGGSPMQGIMLLRKILEENPDNARAHFQMGLFSIQSGQFEKAVDRFEKVLKLEPSNIESLYFLGNAHSNLGNKTEAISYLEQFIDKTDNDESRAEVEKIVEQLKNT
jgi:cytochrome c-type biogenesis protein CcmH/NrfG